MVQSVTGGPGSVVGGKTGAAADLILTATENNPNDIVQRNVTVYATGGEKQDLPSETSPTPPDEAVARVERAAEGDPTISDEQIEDAAIALIQEVADALRAEFGPTVQIAEKIAMCGGSLQEEPQNDGSLQQSGTLELPNFENEEIAEVLVVRENRLPQEIPSHVLGPNNPIELDGRPLLGTITVDSSPSGDASEESQTYDVTASVIQVPVSTRLICQGTNVVCSPTSSTIFGDSTASFSVEVYEQGQLRLVRHDTGESYSLTPSATASSPASSGSCADAKAHLCENLPNVGCNISVMDRAQQKVIAACGAAEADSFFAEAPGMCC